MDIILKLISYNEKYDIEKKIKVEVGSEDWDKLLEEKDFYSYDIETVVLGTDECNDVEIYFSFLPPISDYLKNAEVFDNLTYEDTLYIGAFDEVKDIGNMTELSELIKDKPNWYPFYAEKTLNEVAEDLLDDYDLPYDLRKCIDTELYIDMLVDNGYIETTYGVLVIY